MNLKTLFGAFVLCSSVVLADDWESVSWDDAGWDEPAPAAKAAPKPAPAAKPAPAPAPAPKPAPAPAPAPAPQPAPAPAPQPAPQPAPAPAPQPAPQPAPAPAPQPAPQPAPVPAPQPAPQPAPAPVTQPAPQPAPLFVPENRPAQAAAPAVQPMPVVLPPAGTPLDLKKLTAKDSEDFNVYTSRRQLVSDSITAAHLYIQQVETEVKATMPALAPKGEFEKVADYEKRQSAYNEELNKRTKDRIAAVAKRSAELEEAVEKISKIQSGMLSVVVVNTVPENATVVISSSGESKEAPARFEGIVPGKLSITVSYPAYETRVVELDLKSSDKQELNVTLEEQSIFSKEGEVNLAELLLKNSTKPEEYQNRVVIIEKRIQQTDGERSQIMNKFMATYPKLVPQQPGESESDFNERKDEWQNEGNRQYSELIRRCDKYRTRLTRAIEVLQDYMVAVQGEVIRSEAPKAQVAIGAYDSEAESFNVSVVDSLDRETPFVFSGFMKMPIAQAATFDRASPFKTEVEYLNFPLKTQAGDRYIAMSNLFLSRGGVPFDIKGEFAPVDYSNEPGYVDWKAKSDSILAGDLKTRGLTAEYAYGGEEPSSSSDPWTWRAWTRIVAAVLIVGGVGGGIYENMKANDVVDEYNNLPVKTYDKLKDANDKINKHQTLRNVMYGIAGAGLVAGVLTFVF